MLALPYEAGITAHTLVDNCQKLVLVILGDNQLWWGLKRCCFDGGKCCACARELKRAVVMRKSEINKEGTRPRGLKGLSMRW